MFGDARSKRNEVKFTDFQLRSLRLRFNRLLMFTAIDYLVI